jgi:protein ImuA
MSVSSSRLAAVEQLRGQLRGVRPAAVSASCTPTGLAALDALLPGGGIPSASVIEWISEQPGQSAGSLALRAAARLLGRPGCLAVIDEQRDFFPGVVETHGISLQRLLLVRIPPESPPLTITGRVRSATGSLTAGGQALWALEQTCRSRGVRVVLAWLHRCTSAIVRRLQLAVESSGVVLMLLRPAQALQQPSFADLRLLVKPLPSTRRIQVSLLRARQSLQSAGTTELVQDFADRFCDPEPQR